MTDCVHGAGEYRKLSKDQRILSEKLLIRNIRKRSVVGFSLAIDQRVFDQVMEGVPFAHSAYTLLVLLAVLKFRDFLDRSGVDCQATYYFEAGHAKAKEANLFMEGIPRLGFSRYFFYLGHSFAEKQNQLPLQAADMLAWQHRHFYLRRNEGHAGIRKDFKALVRDHDLFSDIDLSHMLKLRALFEDAKAISGQSPIQWLSFFAGMFR